MPRMFTSISSLIRQNPKPASSCVQHEINCHNEYRIRDKFQTQIGSTKPGFASSGNCSPGAEASPGRQRLHHKHRRQNNGRQPPTFFGYSQGRFSHGDSDGPPSKNLRACLESRRGSCDESNLGRIEARMTRSCGRQQRFA